MLDVKNLPHDEKIISRPVLSGNLSELSVELCSFMLGLWGSAMIRFLILAGYFELTMYLQLSGKLNQYINLHYSYLAYISMFLSFVLALVQLIIWVKQMKIHSHLSSFWAKVASIFLLCIPLFVGLFFPTVTLDSQTVSAKGYHFPVAAGSSKEIQQDEGTTTQYLKPDTSSYFTKSAYESEMKQAAKKYVDKR